MTEKECKYYQERMYDRYGIPNFEHCCLYNDKCDKYPQCIFRDERLQQYKTENEGLKNEIQLIKNKIKPINCVFAEDYLKEIFKTKIYEQCINDIENLTQKGINCDGCESLDCNMCYKNFRNKILQYIKKTKE